MSLLEIKAEIPNSTLGEDQGIEELALTRFQAIDQEEAPDEN